MVYGCTQERLSIDGEYSGKIFDTDLSVVPGVLYTSAKNISVQAEWLRQSGRALSELSETPRCRITPRPASIQRVAFHIAL